MVWGTAGRAPASGGRERRSGGHVGISRISVAARLANKSPRDERAREGKRRGDAEDAPARASRRRAVDAARMTSGFRQRVLAFPRAGDYHPEMRAVALPPRLLRSSVGRTSFRVSIIQHAGAAGHLSVPTCFIYPHRDSLNRHRRSIFHKDFRLSAKHDAREQISLSVVYLRTLRDPSV